MPLPRLQLVGNRLDPFVYEIGWNDRVTRSEFEIDGLEPIAVGRDLGWGGEV